MPHKQFPDRSYRLVVLALVVPCLLVILPAILTRRAERNLTESFPWVTHTLEVKTAIERLQRVLVDAETGQRGLLLTGDVMYLDPYLGALKTYQPQLERLRALTGDNPRQQHNIGDLSRIVEQRLDLIRQTVRLEEEGKHDEALAIVMTGRGRAHMEAIRKLLERMHQEEATLLGQRQHQLARHAHFATAVMLAVLGALALFAVAVFVLLRRLGRLQGLVTVCAWSRTVEFEGEWLSFEEYLMRRFNLNTSHGISPAEAEKALVAFRAPKGENQEAA